jgi:predicted nucleic acid-binding Zn ribbon protein
MTMAEFPLLDMQAAALIGAAEERYNARPKWERRPVWAPAIGEGSEPVNAARLEQALRRRAGKCSAPRMARMAPTPKRRKHSLTSETGHAHGFEYRTRTRPYGRKRDQRPKRSHHKAVAPKPPIVRDCIICGRPFTTGPRGHKARICSPECRRVEKGRRNAARKFQSLTAGALVSRAADPPWMPSPAENVNGRVGQPRKTL